jgi:hypothetical protein
MILEKITRNILHIEDLSIDSLYDTLQNLSEYELTEKVDGAQILFGIDKNGFYTSRETKGGKRIYSVDGYDISFPTTYMRSAHLLLEDALPRLKAAGLSEGDQVEAEVLFGELPNVVTYSKDLNYIIFLRVTEGSSCIDRLSHFLCNTSYEINLPVPFTHDGRTIQLKEESGRWVFVRVPHIEFDSEKIEESIKLKVDTLTAYLMLPSGIADQPVRIIESLPLNKRPVWCDTQDWKLTKHLVKEKKNEIGTIVAEMKANIKEVLLDQVVRNKTSSFGPSLEDGGWIEGVVLRHTVTGKMVKIVDKRIFGTARESAWEKRNKLTERAKSITGELSFIGNLHVSMATVIGHPALGTTQAKNYLRKAGINNSEITFNLTKGLDLHEIKTNWLSLIESGRSRLEEDLHRYEKEENLHEVTCIVQGSINQRTRESFAYIFEKINNMQRKINGAVETPALLGVIVGKQLDDLINEIKIYSTA